MLCLKKRRTYSFTQGACNDMPRRSTKEKNGYNEALNMAVTTLPRKHRSREERNSGAMVLTVTEDTPADMLAGSMELLVQLPKDHNVHTQRVTVPRSTPMMDLLVQIATAHKLAASSYTLQAIGERGLVLPHQPNTPIGALDALQVKLLPKQGTVLPRKAKQANQPFETTFRLQVLLPRNQLYVSRVSPKMNLGKILDEVCREKNLDKNKYELRHPANLEETLDLSLSLQDYHLQEVTLYAKQGRSIGAALSSQDIMALQRQEERRRQQAKQSVFGFMFRKSKESSLSIDSLGGRSVSPARSDETGRSVSPLAPPARPQRKRRPAPKPPVQTSVSVGDESNVDGSKDKLVISHSRNSSDSSGYHEASVLSDNPDSGARMPETLPRRSKPPCSKSETSRKLAQTSESSKSLGNLAMASGGLSHGISSTSISSTGIRKKRAAPPPPIARPLSSAISTQALERIVDSEESLTSDIDISKSPSDIAASSKANSDIGVSSKANSDIGVHSFGSKQSSEIGYKIDSEFRAALAGHEDKICESERRSAPEPPAARFKPTLEIPARPPKSEQTIASSLDEPDKVESARVVKKEAGPPIPKPRSIAASPVVGGYEPPFPVAPRRRLLEPTVDDPKFFISNETDNSPEKNEKMDPKKNPERNNDSSMSADVTPREKRAPLRRQLTADQSTIRTDEGTTPPARALKHVKSLDDLYGVSMEFADEDNSLERTAKIATKKDPENNDSSISADVELREKRASVSRQLIPDQSSKTLKTSSMIGMDAETTPPARVLKHVKSLDDLYGISMEFTDEDVPEENHSPSRVQSCAVISTIPKCAHLTPKMDDESTAIDKASKANSGKSIKSMIDRAAIASSVPKRTKVFRSQSATNDFDVNPFERHTRHFTSHPEDFTCAMNPNVSRSALNIEANAARNRNFETETSQPDEESEERPGVGIEDYPPFITAGANLACEGDSPVARVEDNWPLQFVERSATGDRPTETDILLQKVSDTLSSSLPLSESSVPAVAKKPPEPEDIAAVPQEIIVKHPSAPPRVKDESERVPERSETYRESKEDSKPVKQTETKKRESLLSDKNLVDASTPNATINSQQDTSDYVSATGDDLSITDWEYQLPAPPSAFRDNISPDFDGYDTITLRSVEAFKEAVAEPEEVPVDSPMRESPVPPPVASKEIPEIPKPAMVQKVENSRSQEAAPSQSAKPRLGSRTSSESRSSDKSSELKKEIITELATKIENGSLSQANGKASEQDSRRTSADCAAPKIAPVDNTLSNFTITTYSRQKSLNIFEEEPVEERRAAPIVKSAEEKVERSFATLGRNKSASQNYNGNVGSRNAFNKAENVCRSEEKQPAIGRAQSVDDVIASEMVYKKPEEKIHFGQHDSLLRRPSLSNGQEKSTVVHRSKSYIMLANNSKWRENAEVEKREASSRNEIDDGRIVKSTSVTNLNQEAPRQNEKFSQWRENILKRQEEPSKEKQLQSLQVLKSILPQLKSTQQTEENVLDSPSRKDHSRDKCSETLPEEDRIESKSSPLEERPEAEGKPQKNVEETATKRYKYTGPPAISLGSWSERPRVNVQLKMDTDYKFGTNNTSGAKTVVNLNGRSDEKRDDNRSKESSTNTLPKSVATNGVSTSNGTAARNEASNLRRRDSEDELAKKLITHTTAAGFKKPTLNRIGFQESKNGGQIEDKPIVTSVALKKTHIERSNSRVDQQRRDDEDDERIDTKPVSFKELTKTFGQEVCLRTNPKRVLQNRHSDYYGTRTDVQQNFSSTRNGQAGFSENEAKNARNYEVSNGVQKDVIRPTVKRYTSVVGIQSQNNNNYAENGETVAKNHNATMKMNGLMPVVKGFKIQVGQNEIKANGVSVVENSKKSSNVPPVPPTMPIITGVTLKNSTRPKSMPVCNADPRDQLLESIRSFGGRDKLKNVNTFS